MNEMSMGGYLDMLGLQREEMRNGVLKKLLKLQAIVKLDKNPFPSQDIGKLQTLFDRELDGLKPDLHTYFADIVGFSSWGRKALKWSDDEIDTVEATLEKTFFDKHPEYKIIEDELKNVPGLAREFDVHDRLRLLMLPVLDDLRTLNSGGPW